MKNSEFYYAKRARDYKSRVASRYRSIELEQLIKMMPAEEEFLVTTKYDGHFYVLVLEEEDCYFINPKEKVVRTPALIEAAAELKKKGTASAFCGELYVKSETRTHSFDVTSGITSDSSELAFAAFDILDLDGEMARFEDVGEMFTALQSLLPDEGKIHTVEGGLSSGVQAISESYKSVVEERGLEGLVVKSKGPHSYKVKPKFTFDAIIVGYAEGIDDRQGMLRDFLLAFRKEDGSYQIFAHLSHGFNDPKRKELLAEYSEKIVESEFTEVARNRVAFHMVKPETVIEFSCLDVLAEDSSGSIRKMNLNYSESEGYTANGLQASVSMTIPVYLRFRDDKTPSIQDVRFDQVLDVVEISDEKPKELAKSELITREVYTKESRGSKMVRKFVVYKTNKHEVDPNYPSYVFHYTDYSSGRKDPLKTELRTAEEETAILDLFEASIASNIKSGWNKI